MSADELILVRHGQSTWNAERRWQGQADPPLSALGRTQGSILARQLTRLLGTESTVRVHSSDLRRAADTATILAHAIGCEVELDRDLREIDIGSFSGRTRAQIVEDDPSAILAYHRGEQRWSGGETFDEHEQRSERALATVLAAARTGSVIAVSHGGTIRAMTRRLLGMPHEERWRMTGPGNGGIVHFRRGTNGWRLFAYNAKVEPPED